MDLSFAPCVWPKMVRCATSWLLARSPLSMYPQRATQLFQEIVEGVEQIHSQGYVHGNITPSNILLDEMLHPLLSDFGLPARIGTAVSPFLAPEQVQGGIVDRRADVYALGVLLYTTLVGAEPPAGLVVSPRSRRPDIPEGVERVIFKAMAQNPDQRFQSATEFFSAMRTAFETPAASTTTGLCASPSPACRAHADNVADS